MYIADITFDLELMIDVREDNFLLEQFIVDLPTNEQSIDKVWEIMEEFTSGMDVIAPQTAPLF